MPTDNTVSITGTRANQVEYERDFLLMLILDEEEFGPGAFERAVKKVKAWREQKNAGGS